MSLRKCCYPPRQSNEPFSSDGINYGINSSLVTIFHSENENCHLIGCFMNCCIYTNSKRNSCIFSNMLIIAEKVYYLLKFKGGYNSFRPSFFLTIARREMSKNPEIKSTNACEINQKYI